MTGNCQHEEDNARNVSDESEYESDDGILAVWDGSSNVSQHKRKRKLVNSSMKLQDDQYEEEEEEKVGHCEVPLPEMRCTSSYPGIVGRSSTSKNDYKMCKGELIADGHTSGTVQRRKNRHWKFEEAEQKSSSKEEDRNNRNKQKEEEQQFGLYDENGKVKRKSVKQETHRRKKEQSLHPDHTPSCPPDPCQSSFKTLKTKSQPNYKLEPQPPQPLKINPPPDLELEPLIQRPIMNHPKRKPHPPASTIASTLAENATKIRRSRQPTTTTTSTTNNHARRVFHDENTDWYDGSVPIPKPNKHLYPTAALLAHSQGTPSGNLAYSSQTQGSRLTYECNYGELRKKGVYQFSSWKYRYGKDGLKAKHVKSFRRALGKGGGNKTKLKMKKEPTKAMKKVLCGLKKMPVKRHAGGGGKGGVVRSRNVSLVGESRRSGGGVKREVKVEHG